MKTFLLLAFSFSIALAQVVKAEDQDTVKPPPKTRAKVTTRPVTPAGPHINHVAPSGPHFNHVTPTGPRINHVTPTGPHINRVTPTGPHINQKTVQAKQYHPRVQSTARIHTKPTIPNANVSQKATTPQTTEVSFADKSRQSKDREVNANLRNRNNQNTTVQKRKWQNQTLNNNRWTDARRRHHNEHHDRNWWRSHFTRFALFGSGYYFWDGGYWYPAYGYDSGYNTYDYNEPIYGYNDLDPGQVISSVQTELQRLGYYRYAVDGQMGPATRAAIANYQRDTGLSITSAIDEPTLDSLGLR